MKANTETICPLCGKLIVAHCYEDRAVGIFFDFDILDRTDCDCDLDSDANYQAIGKVLQSAWESRFDDIFDDDHTKQFEKLNEH